VDTLRLGATFGMPTKIEITMAEKIKQLIPSIEKVRMVSSGTEATMSALRLARGYTGKNKIVKFEGCYHGHADYLLIKSGSGTMTFGQPSSPGIPQKIAEETLVATYNDIDSVKKIIDSSTDIAAIIVEPIAGNMGLIVPDISFLRELRKLTQENGIVLIFDEVISGFRASIGGAQELFKIQPDLTCLGKIIGGGLPVGAFGGKSEIMDCLSPDGNVYQAGTLSGNPLAMAAGLETLKILERDMPYDLLNEKAATLASGIRNFADKYHLDVCVNQKGSLLTLFFAKGNISSYKDVQKADTRLYAEFFNKMLNEGIHLPPSQFECWFISTAHTSEDIDKTLSAIDRVFSSLGRI
jgi:glutamate-1-semialdehyde 2,1-aminomutase